MKKKGEKGERDTRRRTQREKLVASPPSPPNPFWATRPPLFYLLCQKKKKKGSGERRRAKQDKLEATFPFPFFSPLTEIYPESIAFVSATKRPTALSHKTNYSPFGGNIQTVVVESHPTGKRGSCPAMSLPSPPPPPPHHFGPDDGGGGGGGGEAGGDGIKDSSSSSSFRMQTPSLPPLPFLLPPFRAEGKRGRRRRRRALRSVPKALLCASFFCTARVAVSTKNIVGFNV